MLRLSRFFALLMAGVIVFAGTLAYADLGDGLVSYWNFDGDLLDSSGNGNDGTGNNGPGFTTGLFGDALDLNPALNQDQWVTAPAGAGANGGPFTVSTWAKVDNFGTSWQALVSKGEGAKFRLHRRGGEQNVAFNAGTGGDTDSLGGTINDGAFHHIVGVYHDDGTPNEIWVDGVLADTHANGTGLDAGGLLYIGTNGESAGHQTGREWEGDIDDMAFWDRPLTGEEIGQLFGGGPQSAQSLGQLLAPVPEPTSVAIWTLLGLFGSLFAWRRWRRR